MEINDDRRHEVAENLRRQLIFMRKNDYYEKDVDVVKCGNSAYRNIAWSVEWGGNFEKGNYVHIVERLAELIDRQTCHNVSVRDDVFKCSECGAEFEPVAVNGNEYEDVFYIPLNPLYCPNCGAEVIK